MLSIFFSLLRPIFNTGATSHLPMLAPDVVGQHAHALLPHVHNSVAPSRKEPVLRRRFWRPGLKHQIGASYLGRQNISGATKAHSSSKRVHSNAFAAEQRLGKGSKGFQSAKRSGRERKKTEPKPFCHVLNLWLPNTPVQMGRSINN